MSALLFLGSLPANHSRLRAHHLIQHLTLPGEPELPVSTLAVQAVAPLALQANHHLRIVHAQSQSHQSTLVVSNFHRLLPAYAIGGHWQGVPSRTISFCLMDR